MKMGFKDPKLDDRQRAALDAKKALLDKFKSQPGPGHPEYEARKKEREAVIAARAARDAAKEAEAREKERLAEARTAGSRPQASGGTRPQGSGAHRAGRAREGRRGPEEGRARRQIRRPQGARQEALRASTSAGAEPAPGYCLTGRPRHRPRPCAGRTAAASGSASIHSQRAPRSRATLRRPVEQLPADAGADRRWRDEQFCEVGVFAIDDDLDDAGHRRRPRPRPAATTPQSPRATASAPRGTPA